MISFNLSLQPDGVSPVIKRERAADLQKQEGVLIDICDGSLHKTVPTEPLIRFQVP